MSDLEIKNRILQKARDYFFKYGFGKVTMNEIATELGMSKKTLYTYFPSKEELLVELLRQMQNEIETTAERLIADEAMDFGQKLNTLMSLIHAYHSKLDAHFLADLQKSAPESWKLCGHFELERMRKNTSAIIRQGVEQGIFRNDVNEEVLVVMYTTLMQTMMTPETLRRLPLSTSDLYDAMMKVLFGGVFTNEGREKYLSQSLGKPVEASPKHEMD